jgi:hypothetical protein
MTESQLDTIDPQQKLDLSRRIDFNSISKEHEASSTPSEKLEHRQISNSSTIKSQPIRRPKLPSSSVEKLNEESKLSAKFPIS